MPEIQNKQKVAFLALTYSSFQQEELMDKFFCPNFDGYSLYIHNKKPFSGRLSKYCVPNKYKVPTEWAQYSLTLATIRMMMVALEDPNNEWFILISDSHCPLYNIRETVKKIKENFPIASFDFYFLKLKNSGIRFDSAIKSNKFCPFKKEDSGFVSQWFVCRRSDAEFFVKNEPKYRKWFVQNSMSFTDEIYFYLLLKTFKKPLQEKSSCYFNRNLTTCKKFAKNGLRLKPKTYSKINKNFVKVLRKTPNLFVRKVTKETKVDSEFILGS